MNIEKLLALLQEYFTYIGIAYKFNTGGMFAAINLRNELKKLESEYKAGSAFKEMIDCIQEWDGNFNSLNQTERALNDLTQKVIKKNISQDIIIEKWKRRAELKGEKAPAEIEGGFCAGLSYTSGLGIVLSQASSIAQNVPLEDLKHFEALLEKIAAWDGCNLSAEIEACFKILEDFALPLQRRQFEEFNAVSDKIAKNLLPQQVLNLSFVHNTATLKHKFMAILQPGRFVFFTASRHAARAYVTQDGKIIYYNPNEKHGYLCFDLDHIDYFLEKIPSGFTNCYSDRFGLTTTVYDFTPQKQSLNLEKLLNDLIDIAVKSDSSAAQAVIDAQDSRCMTALNLACYANGSDQTGILLGKNANPNIKNVEGSRPIHYAARRGNVTSLRSLLAQETIILNSLNTDGYAPLHCAVVSGNCDAVRILLEDKRILPNIKLNEPSNTKGLSNHTALHLAALCDANEIAGLLVGHPDVKLNEAEDAYKLTPLHLAASHGNKGIVGMLLQQRERLDIDAVSNEIDEDYPLGMTALCYAMNNDRYEVARKLFQEGADIKYLPMSLCWELLNDLINNDPVNSEKYFDFVAEKLPSHALDTDEQDENFIDFVANVIAYNKTGILKDLIERNPNIAHVMFASDQEKNDETVLMPASPVKVSRMSLFSPTPTAVNDAVCTAQPTNDSGTEKKAKGYGFCNLL